VCEYESHSTNSQNFSASSIASLYFLEVSLIFVLCPFTSVLMGYFTMFTIWDFPHAGNVKMP
jgi:hypothetical protein